MLKITCLSLSVAFGLSLGVSSGNASTDIGTKATSINSSTFETAHLKRKKKSHRHCHTSLINQRLVKTCHKHRHWFLHHIRKG